MPPALPRPPTCTCACTATVAPIARAAASASSGVVARRPSGIGIPARARSCLAWYSWSFTGWRRGYRRGVRRVSVVGPTGAGKTTFAKTLAAALGVPYVELDALNWLAGWREAGAEELRARVTEVIVGDAWSIDGNYWPR